jgi:hypothetical protein
MTDRVLYEKKIRNNQTDIKKNKKKMKENKIKKKEKSKKPVISGQNTPCATASCAISALVGPFDWK